MDGRTSIKKKKKTRVAKYQELLIAKKTGSHGEPWFSHILKGDCIEKRLTAMNNIQNRTIITLYCNKFRWGIEDLLLPWLADKEGW